MPSLGQQVPCEVTVFRLDVSEHIMWIPLSQAAALADAGGLFVFLKGFDAADTPNPQPHNGADHHVRRLRSRLRHQFQRQPGSGPWQEDQLTGTDHKGVWPHRNAFAEAPAGKPPPVYEVGDNLGNELRHARGIETP